MKPIGRLTALAAASVLACSSAGGPVTFISLAEGLTASVESGSLEAEPRMFTAADDFCRSVPEATRLAATGPEVVRVGEPLLLTRFTVRAVGAGGRLLRVPIAVELNEGASERLDHLRFEETGVVVFESAGRVWFRFRTICQDPEATTRARVIVED